MSAVTKEDIARLHAYLVVPVAVNEVMNSGLPMIGETQYGLHVSLSEIEPDSALLAIALSAQRIAAEFYADIPVAAALKMEADKIISEYGPEWLANFHRHPIQGQDLFELLCHVPEDLEAMADLLESVQASIINTDHPAHGLCTVLAVQARAHMDIADFVLGEIEAEDMGIQAEWTQDGVCHTKVPVLLGPVPEDNIIPFPSHRRR
jgi:hypothetical protein